MNVLPDNSFKQYVKVFTGVVLIIIVISPINVLGNLTNDIGDMYDSITIKNNVKELKDVIEQGQEKYLYSYLEEIKNQINKEIKTDRYVTDEVELIYDGDNLCGMNICVSKMTVDEEIEEKESEVTKIDIIDQVKIKWKEVKKEAEVEETYSKDVEALIIKIKNYISNFYNLEVGNINITIQR